MAAAPSRPPARSDRETYRSLRVFNAAFGVFVAAGLVEIVLGVLAMWSNARLRGDVASYGWGNVPEERLALLIFAEKYALILDYAPLILVGVAFLVAMGFARRLARAAGVELVYGYRWTVVALFIPILNVVRPWLGFAEIRRAILHTAAEGRPTSFGGFSYMTLLLGLAVAVNAILQRGFRAQLERLPPPESAESFQAYMDQYESLTVLSNGGQLVLLLVMCAYLVTIRTGAVLIADRARGRLAVEP